MNHTTNYNLNQWEATDKVQRVDFNADNAKIDAAIKAVDARVDGLSGSKAEQAALDTLSQTVAGHTAALAGKGNCRIATGTYTGTGNTGADNKVTLTFPFEPKLVIVQNIEGALTNITNSSNTFKAMMVLVRPLKVYDNYQGGEPNTVSWTSRGVSWYGDSASMMLNSINAQYIYVALG